MQNRDSLFSKLKEIPGVILFIPWFCMHQGICEPHLSFPCFSYCQRQTLITGRTGCIMAVERETDSLYDLRFCNAQIGVCVYAWRSDEHRAGCFR